MATSQPFSKLIERVDTYILAMQNSEIAEHHDGVYLILLRAI